jgi:hypothetical protein
MSITDAPPILLTYGQATALLALSPRSVWTLAASAQIRVVRVRTGVSAATGGNIGRQVAQRGAWRRAIERCGGRPTWGWHGSARIRFAGRDGRHTQAAVCDYTATTLVVLYPPANKFIGVCGDFWGPHPCVNARTVVQVLCYVRSGTLCGASGSPPLSSVPFSAEIQMAVGGVFLHRRGLPRRRQFVWTVY